MKKTFQCISIGLIISTILLIPDISIQYQLEWKIVETELMYLTQGIIYIEAFLHEIGHTISNWFYGYAYTPIVDLEHGGGPGYSEGKHWIVQYLTYALLAIGLFYWKDHKPSLFILLCIGLFHSITAYNDAHKIIMVLSGYALPLFLACYFLHRAWSNTAPRGNLERYLNATIGFSLLFHQAIIFWGISQKNIQSTTYNPKRGEVALHDIDALMHLVPSLSKQEIGSYGLIFIGLLFITPIIFCLYAKTKGVILRAP